MTASVMAAVARAEAATPRAATETHCPYCALQCGMELVEGGAGLEVAARDFPTNRGGLCRKGWTAAELLDAPDRLTIAARPSRRAVRQLAPRVSWAEALATVASRIRDVQRVHGPDAVGVFGGGALTNEKAYALGKLARVVLGTKSIDYNGRFCMASAAVAGQLALGIDRGLPFPLTDVAHAETVLLVGANPAETMPPLMQHFDEQRARGGKLIVADPRRTPTAAQATLHLPLTPGTDAALANALLHVCLRDRLVDDDFIAHRTRGFEKVRHAVASYWPDRAERITGVPAADIVATAHMLGEAQSAMILTARGAEQQVQGVRNVLAFVNLALVLGLPGRAHSGYGCLTGQGNGQGGREHGQKSDQLPGYRRIDNPAHRAHVARVWGVPEASLPGAGPSACELLRAMGDAGGVRALIVVGSNLVVSAPDAQAVEARLGKLDLLVVIDPFPSETAQRADVVLPSCQWAEEEGTMTNLEGRILYRRPARAPPPDTRTDLQIFADLAEALGRGGYLSASPQATFDELRRCSAGGVADYAGATYARLRSGESIYWPCPAESHPGTPRLFADRFPTPTGRARLPRGRAPRVRRGAGCRLSLLPDDGAGPRALPVGHADAARAITRFGGAGAVRGDAPPGRRRGTASGPATGCGCVRGGAARAFACAPTTRSVSTRSSSPSTGTARGARTR